MTLLVSYITSSPTPTPTQAPASQSHATLPIQPANLFVKISLSNEPSIALFRSLGFRQYKVNEKWEEMEMHLEGDSQIKKQLQKFDVYRWPMAV